MWAFATERQATIVRRETTCSYFTQGHVTFFYVGFCYLDIEHHSLELWSSHVMPSQHRYRSLSVGLWGVWGLQVVGLSKGRGYQVLGLWGSGDFGIWSFGVLWKSQISIGTGHSVWGFGEPGDCEGRAPDVRSSPCTLAVLLLVSSFSVCMLQPSHSRL